MRALIAILLFLAGVALIFWAGKPLWEEISLLKTERKSAERTLSELGELQTARDSLLTAYNSVSKSDLEKLDQVIPQSPDTGSILVSLEKISQGGGIRLRKAEFKTEDQNSTKIIQAASPMFDIIDLSFVVSSNYDSFKSFLSALEKNSRVIDVTNISFSVGQTNFYEFIIQANAYYKKGIRQVIDLKEINNINLDTSFFLDPRFVELEVAPTPPSSGVKKGRTNPFVSI